MGGGGEGEAGGASTLMGGFKKKHRMGGVMPKPPTTGNPKHFRVSGGVHCFGVQTCSKSRIDTYLGLIR